MTDKRDFKSIVRDRQRKTGESYTAARVQVERERNRLLGIPDEPTVTQVPVRVDAAVLKVGSSTARIAIATMPPSASIDNRAWRTMFSTTTIASSTRMPIEKISAKRVIRFSV